MDRRMYMRPFGGCTYMQPLSIGMMAALAVKPSSIVIMATVKVTAKETLFLVPNSHLSFNLEENSFIKILRTSYRLNGISTLQPVQEYCLNYRSIEHLRHPRVRPPPVPEPTAAAPTSVAISACSGLPLASRHLTLPGPFPGI